MECRCISSIILLLEHLKIKHTYLPFSDTMRLKGLTYYKCVHCRQIVDFCVYQNNDGFTVYCRPGQPSLTKYCRSMGRLESEFERLLFNDQRTQLPIK